MRSLVYLLVILLSTGSISLSSIPAVNLQENSPVQITSPVNGEILQGMVSILGSCELPGFNHAEIAFTYAGINEINWFTIAELENPITNDLLAEWDTSNISDGEYQLRLRVFTDDGAIHEALVPSILIMNAVPIESITITTEPTEVSTPTANLIEETPGPPDPTPLPANPLMISTRQLTASAAIGGGIVLVLILGALFSTRVKKQ